MFRFNETKIALLINKKILVMKNRYKYGVVLFNITII